MNLLSVFIYLIDVVGALDVLLFIAAMFSAIVVVGLGIGCSAGAYTFEDWVEKYAPVFKKCWWIPIAFAFGSVLVPSTNSMYMIAGSQSLEAISKLEQVQSIGGEVGGLATDTIKMLRDKIAETAGPIKKEKDSE